ncbi:MAG TPA: hypothetical protein VND98_07030 [Solirubrobacterales bacterium]|nr:hypothetical protein [Solirubrobacterales bacterium]
MPRRPRRLASLLLLPALILIGCGSTAHPTRSAASLLTGTHAGPIPAAQLPRAAGVADRFAAAYARSVYRLHVPRLPEATLELQRRIEAVAVRVPPARVGLRPRALSVVLEPQNAVALRGRVTIGDGRSTPFSVGFLLERRGLRWLAVAISAPS